ncbi:MAG: hypothetical protein OXK80_05680 [Bdellovibrionales bacterium]|nr:hypothetical protein [Bdellovibrionales bacterium]
MNLSLYTIFILLFTVFFTFDSFSMEDEMVFELKREAKKKTPIKKKKKTTPLKFQRKSFSYDKDFLVFNEKENSSLKKGSILKVNIPYSVISSFNEDFPVYGIIIYPFKGIIAGKIKGVKNTNKALVTFNEVIMNNNLQKIKSFPVFLTGDLKESLFKDITLNFFESLPSILSLTLQDQVSSPQIHFVNTDLQNKVNNLSALETEKKKLAQYIELKDIKILNIVIK